MLLKWDAQTLVIMILSVQKSSEKNLLKKRDNLQPQSITSLGDVTALPNKHLAETLITVKSFDTDVRHSVRSAFHNL